MTEVGGLNTGPWSGVGFLEDPTTLVVDGIEFVLAFGPASVPGRFTLIKTPGLLDRYRGIEDEIRGGTVVELGIAQGGSAAWLALAMEPSLLIAVDIVDQRVGALDALIADRGLAEVVRPHYGVDQSDRQRLREIVEGDLGGAPIDVVIDDASHLLTPTRASFETLFPLMRPGGVYVFEDWVGQHQQADAYAEAFPQPDTYESEYLAAVAEELSARTPTPETEPLSRLVIELTLAQATWGPTIAGITVDPYWITVRRGPAALDPLSFRLRELYLDHFGLDPSSTRPD